MIYETKIELTDKQKEQVKKCIAINDCRKTIDYLSDEDVIEWEWLDEEFPPNRFLFVLNNATSDYRQVMFGETIEDVIQEVQLKLDTMWKDGYDLLCYDLERENWHQELKVAISTIEIS